MKKTVALHNLGCKVNAYELERMSEKLSNSGYTIVPFSDRADFYIVNTCSVTNIADRKSRQLLHRARANHPGAVIVAAGCYVDTHRESDSLAEQADILVPNEEKNNIVEILKAWEQAHGTDTDGIDPVSDSHPDTGLSDCRHPAEGGYTRAFLKVQDGCNQFCAYCIIPYARGRIRSRSIEDVLSETRKFIRKGYREFILTGIHLSSYGLDRSGEGEELLTLVQRIADCPGVDRIRLSSLEPRIVTEEFARTLSQIPALCPHFHLSLQSGSDSVLKRMNRHYTTDQYRRGVDILREFFANPAITTDIIVGFPGESQEEFEQTRSFVEDIKFYETHIFKYSRRKGTPADRMKGQLTEAEKGNRSRILQDIDNRRRIEFADSFIGLTAREVLTEQLQVIDGQQYLTGYTREYVRVACPASGLSPNCLLSGTITGRLNQDTMLFCPDHSCP
ncbi:MAG: tRNA (N(6)-L-threonylcarbamoyladenosine(37)-C(2))-methylthiotransferase MtaB [Lachnospiraceae bacterium]|nr:tRNA (N(6)-L-threonylcarbamoyladenosine(37)-C(2))-methylthiotransferase MtaB [Lachnospiraceae bacterium]